MIVWDLDGTLADCEHRRHFVSGYEKRWVDEEKYFGEKFKGQWGYHCFNKDGTIWNGKKDWKAFYEACDNDKPIIPTLTLLTELSRMGTCPITKQKIRNIEIWSGRCESVKGKTYSWLTDQGLIQGEEFTHLKMRPIGDYTPDDVLKEKWLDERINDMGNQAVSDIQFVFEDHPKAIRMWQRRGIFVFNCNQIGEEF